MPVTRAQDHEDGIMYHLHLPGRWRTNSHSMSLPPPFFLDPFQALEYVVKKSIKRNSLPGQEWQPEALAPKDNIPRSGTVATSVRPVICMSAHGETQMNAHNNVF